MPLTTIAFSPKPVDASIAGQLTRVLNCLHRWGMPKWFDYAFVEATANVALFIPVGIVAVLAFPRRAVWQHVCLGLAVSCCIEAGQALFLPDRFASVLDIAVNTMGTAVGSLAIAAVRRWRA